MSSNIARNKHGNLSKVKYFLPHYKPVADSQEQPQRVQNSYLKHRASSSKHAHTKSLQEPQQISFEIVGISQPNYPENNSKANKENLYPKNHGLPKKMSVQKNIQALKGLRNSQKSIEASMSSIRALTNSREWKLPQGPEKDEFLSFIETLKKDETYQQTITMFTIMYFYEKKKSK